MAVTPLEEWIEYLKTGCIRPDTQAPGLAEARKKLIYYNMEPAEREAYDRHVDAIMIQNDVLGTAKQEGLQEGREEGLQQGLQQGIEQGLEQGLEQGRMEEKFSIARNLKSLGFPIDGIAKASGLSVEEIEKL